MLTVHMSGLMYFHGCNAVGEKVALLPNGMRPDFEESDPIPPHYASFWVESGQVDKDLTSWPEVDPSWPEGPRLRTEYEFPIPGENRVTEFRIPYPALGPTPITFPDVTDAPARFHCFDYALPKLERNGFKVNLATPKAIARVKISGGALEVFNFKEVASVRWTIANDPNPIKIQASEHLIALKRSDAEIVLSNNSKLVPKRDETQGKKHFKLYAKLDMHENEGCLNDPPRPNNLDPLQFDHPYLRYLDILYPERLPDAGCTPTCCG